MLGSSFSSMLPYVDVTLSYFPPPPPISYDKVHSSSSSESITNDPKVVLDFFLGGEVIGSRLNMSLGVGGLIYVFDWWDSHVGKGDVVVKLDGLLSFKKCSLVTSSSETYRWYALGFFVGWWNRFL